MLQGLRQIERVFRDLEHVVDIRPVYHRLEDRIRAHVLLWWLAMLLIRVAENESGWTWHKMRRERAKPDVGIHRTRSGEVWQRSHPTEELEAPVQGLGTQSATPLSGNSDPPAATGVGTMPSATLCAFNPHHGSANVLSLSPRTVQR